MRLDIGQVISNEKYVLDFAFCEDLSQKRMVDGEKPFYKPVKVSGSVKNRSGGIELDGTVKAECRVPCARCLDDVFFSLSCPLSAFIRGEKDKDKDKDEQLVSITDGRLVDLGEAVDAALMYEYPLKVLCRQDCKGLCTICGTNLNHGGCGCLPCRQDGELPL